MEGVLYVVATPIGNLKDITLRAVEVLKDVDLIVAENRERALKLLSHLSIHKPIITINSYNEERKANNIARQIASGKSCALISGAGTPCISDPAPDMRPGLMLRLCQVHVQLQELFQSPVSVLTDLFSMVFCPKNKVRKERFCGSFLLFPIRLSFLNRQESFLRLSAVFRKNLETDLQ